MDEAGSFLGPKRREEAGRKSGYASEGSQVVSLLMYPFLSPKLEQLAEQVINNLARSLLVRCDSSSDS